LIRNKLTGKTSIVKIVKDPKKAKSIDEHLSGVSRELKALFSEINERILQISDEIERYMCIPRKPDEHSILKRMAIPRESG